MIKKITLSVTIGDSTVRRDYLSHEDDITGTYGDVVDEMIYAVEQLNQF